MKSLVSKVFVMMVLFTGFVNWLANEQMWWVWRGLWAVVTGVFWPVFWLYKLAIWALPVLKAKGVL